MIGYLRVAARWCSLACCCSGLPVDCPTRNLQSNQCFINQACKVKMAGYWPASFFSLCVYMTLTLSWSINMRKKNLANIQPSWPHTWSITGQYVWISLTPYVLPIMDKTEIHWLHVASLTACRFIPASFMCLGLTGSCVEPFFSSFFLMVECWDLNIAAYSRCLLTFFIYKGGAAKMSSQNCVVWSVTAPMKVHVVLKLYPRHAKGAQLSCRHKIT